MPKLPPNSDIAEDRSVLNLKQNSTLGRIVGLCALFKEVLGVWRICLMLLSALIISLVELVGLALIFPFIKLVTDPNSFQPLLERLGGVGATISAAPHKTVVLSVGLGLTVLYVLKGIVHVKLVEFQARISALINKNTSSDLIRTALFSRYQLFQDHGAVKIAAVSYSNTTHAALLFQSIMSATNELVLLVIIFVAVSIASPLLSLLVIAAISFCAVGFFLPLSRRVAQIGRQTQAIDLARHRFVFAMANAIRDIKIMGLESSFSERNRSIAYGHADLAANYTSVSATQRIAVEAILVCAVVGACIWFSLTEQDLVAQAPLIVTIGLVAVRAAPGLARLAAAYSAFRYSLPFVEGLLAMRADLRAYPQPRHADSVDFKGVYAAENLQFGYRDKQVLDGASVSIPKGSVVAIVGSSGAGKSTLLDLLAGLQPAEAGRFSMDEKPFQPFGSSDFSRQIGYVPQLIALLDSSLAYNISLEDDPDPERLRAAVEKANLSEFVASLPLGLKTLLGEGGQSVSGGQRQRIGIARALYRRPALLILDEATSALDADTAKSVMAELMLLRGDTTLLIVTHNLSSVGDADAVYRLEGGKLMRCAIDGSQSGQ